MNIFNSFGWVGAEAVFLGDEAKSFWADLIKSAQVPSFVFEISRLEREAGAEFAPNSAWNDGAGRVNEADGMTEG